MQALTDRRYERRAACADCGRRRLVAAFTRIGTRTICRACQSATEARIAAWFPNLTAAANA